MNPLVSIIVPCYNSSRFIRTALDSIFQQSYSNYEIIVVNDESTDDTEAILLSYWDRINYVKRKNGGPSAAKNSGLEIAQGDFITFLDHDDTFAPNKLEIQVKCLQENVDALACIGKSHYVFSEGATPDLVIFPDDTHEVHNYLLGSMLFRKEVFEKYGLFNENLIYAEDIDLVNRLRENQEKMVVINEVTLHYSMHSSNLTKNRMDTAQGMIKALKLSLDRRRKEGEIKPHTHLKDL
jgi:glycosyltransferase involved in cell wall biosynthesis